MESLYSGTAGKGARAFSEISVNEQADVCKVPNRRRNLFRKTIYERGNLQCL